MADDEALKLEVEGQVVRVTHPEKVVFPEAGHTKEALVRYYLAVAQGALRGVRGRPMALKRFPRGISAPPFFQKRAPSGLPPSVQTCTVTFPSGATAEEVVLTDAAGLGWAANLGCVDLNPHAVTTADLAHPDELRIDLDPNPGVSFADVKAVALVVREVLEAHGHRAFAKTSGSRGIHVYARLAPRWGFDQVRRAALAVAREVEKKAPALATSAWWKEERRGVFLDYNQNAQDRTMASAYSVRPTPDARVSAPVTWEELPDVELSDFTLASMPARFAALGDPWAAIDGRADSLEPLLEVVQRHEAEGQGDAPWPPHYPKRAEEPRRAPPSKRKKPGPPG